MFNVEYGIGKALRLGTRRARSFAGAMREARAILRDLEVGAWAVVRLDGNVLARMQRGKA